ncbi:MAG TPA: DNA-protecting protein DprA [Alphaproteobacteria bacterium]|nr:DNA-protecting protein DprA [Alphaproteobacteria bacterium]
MAEQTELLNILRLMLTEGVGPITFYKHMQTYKSLEKVLQAVAVKKPLCPQSKAEDEIAKAQKLGVKLIAYTDSRYPESLRQLNDAPPVLYALGNTDLLNYPLSMAVVGARNASINGRKIASRIAYDLTENDVLVVSGMARGIDSAAHKGAMYAKNKLGPTIAVLGTGLDVIYPAENKDLYQMIAAQGLIISELPFGTAAQVSTFPRRNRIISALAAGTLVVEASLHSGSLITAKCALEQGKDIFAVPGSPLENRSQGPNHLIKEGAVLTENAEDILNILSISQNRQIKSTQLSLKPLDKVENSVNISDIKIADPLPEKEEKLSLIELITFEGVDIDELLRSSGLAQAEFFSQLLDLEFSGKIERQAGNRVARLK